MAKTGLYRGFSSFTFQSKKTFKVNDINLIKLDLLNHIFTSRGERVMMPTFGTSIPEMVFEPLDSEALNIIEDELLDVFNFDPRVEILDLRVLPDFDNSSVSVFARILYIELAVTDDMEFNLVFES